MIQFNKEFQNMTNKTALRIYEAKNHILKYHQPAELIEVLKTEMPRIGIELNSVILECLNVMLEDKPTLNETKLVKNAQQIQKSFNINKPGGASKSEKGQHKLKTNKSNKREVNIPETVVVVDQENLPSEIQDTINQMMQQPLVENIDEIQSELGDNHQHQPVQNENKTSSFVSNKAVLPRSP
jgi:predicted metal-dependent hydrolase